MRIRLSRAGLLVAGCWATPELAPRRPVRAAPRPPSSGPPRPRRCLDGAEALGSSEIRERARQACAGPTRAAPRLHPSCKGADRGPKLRSCAAPSATSCWPCCSRSPWCRATRPRLGRGRRRRARAGSRRAWSSASRSRTRRSRPRGSSCRLRPRGDRGLTPKSRSNPRPETTLVGTRSSDRPATAPGASSLAFESHACTPATIARAELD